MEIYIRAFGKELPSHKVFIGNLKKDEIKDSYIPSHFDGKLICCGIKSDSINSNNYAGLYEDENGIFEPIFTMSVAVELKLNGNYRVNHVFRKREIIYMLASLLRKSDLPDVVEQLNCLVNE